MRNRERAKNLLTTYLMMAIHSAGSRWTSDNSAEVEELVDCLIDAAVEEVQAAEKPATTA